MTAPAEPSRGTGRRAILAAAADVIARRGLRGLSVDHVARAARVTPPLVYYHFADRRALITAALEHANDLAPSITALSASEEADGLATILAALGAELDERSEVRNLNVIWNEVGALAVFDARVRADLKRVTARWDETVALGIARGIEDGSIRPGVEAVEAAEILTCLVEGLSQRWLARSIDLDDARAALRDAVCRLLARSAAERRAPPAPGRRTLPKRQIG